MITHKCYMCKTRTVDGSGETCYCCKFTIINGFRPPSERSKG